MRTPKPAAPRSPHWDKVKRPDLVTRMVLIVALGHAAVAACAMVLAYALMGWLFFDAWTVKGLLLAALLAGSVGFTVGFRNGTALIHAALKMPDDDHA